jgi:tRNA nucleotidyltransferase/poly(A) polymerase
VRNKLIKKIHDCECQTKDYDILVTQLCMNDLADILLGYGIVKEVGKHFGVLLFKINIHKKLYTFDIAIPRKEESTGYHYQDFNIVKDKDIPIEVDLERRDATINSIAIQIYTINDLELIHFSEENIIDPFNGINDIKKRLWRATGNPHKRFLEDPTRIMRAIRQCSELNFQLDEVTKDAIIKYSKLIYIVVKKSTVRIANEFVRLLKSDHVTKWIKFILVDTEIGKCIGLVHANNLVIASKIIASLKIVIKMHKLISVRVSIFLNHVFDNSLEIINWIKQFELSAVPYFNKKHLKFLELSKNKIIWLDSIKDNNCSVGMRKLIQNLEFCQMNKKYGYMLMLLDVYECCAGCRFSNLDILYEENQFVVVNESEINLRGNDIKNYFGIYGIDIGNLKKWLFNAITEEKVENKKDKLINYVNQYYF